VLNAANEVAVASFLDSKLAFTRIAVMVEQVLTRYSPRAPASLSDVIAVDAEARARARELLELV
jgi:1-deoxy-D-xylulose-5-phosphate reductoisomerase